LYKDLPNDESVLTFDETNLDFTADSSDDNLIGSTQTYAIKAEFLNYPGAISDVAEGTITFISPCKTLQNF
jgi:hypothetical protein